MLETHSEDTGGMEIQQIMGMLMHRYPFLLVDRVLNCVPGSFIRGYKNVCSNDSFFRRHADGSRAHAVPQLLLIEALAQISVILTFKTLRIEPTGQEFMFFAGIDDARFNGSAKSGDRLDLRSEVVRLKKAMGWFRGTAKVNGEIVAEMSMLAAIKLG